MSSTITLPQYQDGIVREAAADELLSPVGSVEFALNLNFDRIGAVQPRLGTTQVGETISGGSPVYGMGVYRNNAGTAYAALAMSGTSVYAYQGSSWAAVRTGLTDGSRARFTNLVDYTFMVNGNGNEACATWGGSGSFGTTNVADLPAGDLIENFRSRVWIGDSSNDKLYYSDVVNTDNTITGGSEFIQINPADGERMTGLKRHPRALLVFKQNHIYRVFSINSTDPDPSINRGTYSQESIVEAKDGIYYHHPSGFYKFVFDGEQEEISRPIVDIVKAIPRSSYESIVGWADDDHVNWYIGDITLGGVDLTNVVVRRTISTQLWTFYSYPTAFTSTALYDSGANLMQLIGDEGGNVFEIDTGEQDFDGSEIHYDLITHPYYLTERAHQAKSFSELVALHENAAGAQVGFRLDQDDQHNTTNFWRSAGSLGRGLYDVLSADAQDFTRVRLRLSGNYTGDPFIFRGFEVLDLETKGEQRIAH